MQVGKVVAHLCPLLWALVAFMRMGGLCFWTGGRWYEAEAAIVRGVIGSYLAHPRYVFHPTA